MSGDKVKIGETSPGEKERERERRKRERDEEADRRKRRSRSPEKARDKEERKGEWMSDGLPRVEVVLRDWESVR